MNQFGIPEISAPEVATKREAGESFLLVDVREANELALASLGDAAIHLPLSVLAEQRLDAIPAEMDDKEQEIVIMCHHGNRSAQVAAFLRASGWTNVHNMTGGIHAYASLVDDSIGTY